MLIALVAMLGVWGVASLIKRYWLKSLGVLVSLGISLALAGLGAFLQIYMAATLSESSGLEVDAMGLLSNAFLTFCIAWYAGYKSLKGHAAPTTKGL